MKAWWFDNSGATHLDDETLLVASSSPGVCNETVQEHLASCSACSGRAALVANRWEVLRRDAELEADREFTGGRLARQRALIARRLAQHGQPGRVLHFPAAPRPVVDLRRLARRWVAAAAVVGLLVGAMAGRFVDGRPDVFTVARSTERAAALSPLATPSLTSSASAIHSDSDEDFLHELDMAAARPRIAPLTAIEEMTPRLSDGARGTR